MLDMRQPRHEPSNEPMQAQPVDSMHVYEVRPRKDHRGVDLIFDVLPFGRFAAERTMRRRLRQA